LKKTTDMKKIVLFFMRLAGMILFTGESNKPPRKFTYCDYSKTIRLMPQNYLVAVSRYDDGYNFIADPDAAISSKLAVPVFITLRRLRFERNRETILTELRSMAGWSLEDVLDDAFGDFVAHCSLTKTGNFQIWIPGEHEDEVIYEGKYNSFIVSIN